MFKKKLDSKSLSWKTWIKIEETSEFCWLMSTVWVGNLSDIYIPALLFQTCPVSTCLWRIPQFHYLVRVHCASGHSLPRSPAHAASRFQALRAFRLAGKSSPSCQSLQPATSSLSRKLHFSRLPLQTWWVRITWVPHTDSGVHSRDETQESFQCLPTDYNILKSENFVVSWPPFWIWDSFLIIYFFGREFFILLLPPSS